MLRAAMQRGGARGAPKGCGVVGVPLFLHWLLYGPLAGPGDFLLLAQKKVTKEKGRPGSPPLPRELVAVPPALLDRPGGLRNSRDRQRRGKALRASGRASSQTLAFEP
jgi:hypothetical protein